MVFKLQKKGFSFFWKCDDSALESLELSTLKKFDLKKEKSDCAKTIKNGFLRLILVIVTKNEDVKNFRSENRKKNHL